LLEGYLLGIDNLVLEVGYLEPATAVIFPYFLINDISRISAPLLILASLPP
jgi:hypothetical protein